MAQMKAAHKKQIACRQAALPYLDPPGERVEIPYEGKTLAGILRKPKGIDKPPVVVMAVGLDSTKEETEAYEVPFLARGIATLVFEGPGQGEGQYDFAIRGDYEVPVHAVLDYMETRRDLDTSRIGMWGVSLGGYYAPRATAFEKRIKACIALGGPFEFSKAWDTLPQVTREAIRVAHACGLRRGSGQEDLQAVDGRRGAEHHGADLHRQRTARPPGAGLRRRAAGARGQGPGRTDDRRGRQPHRHQPRLPLALAERGLDEGAVGVDLSSSWPGSTRPSRERRPVPSDADSGDAR